MGAIIRDSALITVFADGTAAHCSGASTCAAIGTSFVMIFVCIVGIEV